MVINGRGVKTRVGACHRYGWEFLKAMGGSSSRLWVGICQCPWCTLMICMCECVHVVAALHELGVGGCQGSWRALMVCMCVCVNVVAVRHELGCVKVRGVYLWFVCACLCCNCSSCWVETHQCLG